jgi:Putative Ig domain
MKHVKGSRLIVAAVLGTVSWANSGCAGGSNAAPPPPPLAISLAIVPAGAQTIDQGQTKGFVANVSNDSSNKGVNWTLTQDGSACSPGCGTIAPASTSSGQPATYTAPAAVNANLQFSITAASVSDGTKFQTDSTTAVPPPALNNPATLPAVTVGQPYSYQLTENGGVPPYTWSIISGSLPAGLTLNQSSGLISGTPTSAAAAVREAVKPAAAASSGVQICFKVQIVDSGNPPIVNSQQVCINVAGVSNAVPTLMSLSPTTAPIGAGPLLLTITGTNFISTSTVGFGTDSLTSSILVNPAGTQIIVTVPAADLSTVGSAAVTVTNPAPGGGTSNSLPFTVANPPISVSVSLEQGCSSTIASVPMNGTCLVYAKVVGETAQGPFGVTWTLDDAAGCPGESCGTVLPEGRVPETTGTYAMLYFGPDTPSSFPSTVTVKATSVADPTQSGTATITLNATPPSVGIVSPLISANAEGTTGGSGDSLEPVVNMDGGYVAFTSSARDLGFSITQPTEVFWKSTCVGQPATCVPLGTIMLGEGDGPSRSPSISGDGQAVGFLSVADDLDPNHVLSTGGAGQFAYVATACVSAAHCSIPPPHMVSVGNILQPDGTTLFRPDNSVGTGSISPDSRFMVFASSGEILGQTTFPGGIYIADACTTVATPPCIPETVSFVSNDDSGDPLNPAPSGAIASQLTSGVSGFIVFASPATSQLPGATNGLGQVYERDLSLGRTSWVSQDNSGNPAPSPWGGLDPSVSSDGRFVGFISSGLATNDTNGLAHLYVRDTCFGVLNCTSTTTVVDVATTGPNAGKSSASGIYLPNGSHHAISADGRYVLFESTSLDLAPNAPQIGSIGGNIGVYVRDMSCAAAASACSNAGIHVVSLTSGGTPFGEVGRAAISGDGHYVVFEIEGAGHAQVVLARTGF